MNERWLPPRLGTQRDPSRPTFGPMVAKVAEQLGFKLYPWQRHVLDVSLEYWIDEEGVPRLYYREIRLWVPRQSGKTTLIVSLMAWRCLFGPQLFGKKQGVLFYSTTGQHAIHKWQDEHKPLLEESLLKDEFEPRGNNGHQAFVWNNGSLWSLGASTEKSGHGDSLDMVMADEFFAQDDDRIEEGARATLITRVSPQIWFVSTFGSADPKKSHKSEPMRRKIIDGRRRCRNDEHGSVATFEWSAADYDEPDTIDYSDQTLWKRTLPSLRENNGHPEYSLAAVQAEWEAMEHNPAAFKRCYLNLLPPKDGVKPDALIRPAQWSRIVSRHSRHMVGHPLALGIDVEQDDSWAALSVVGKGVIPATQHLELVGFEKGSDWLMDAVAKMAFRRDVKVICLDGGSQAGRFLPELEVIGQRAGIEIVPLTGRRYQQACESFRVAAVEELTLRNNVQPNLAAAVDEGLKRMSGDMWLWDRKTPTAPLAPLVSATVAHRAWEELKAKNVTSAYDEMEDDDMDLFV